MRVTGIMVEDGIDVLYAAGTVLTASANSGAQDGYKNLDATVFVATVTAQSGTAPTLDIKIQDSIDSGATWEDTGIAFTQMTTVLGSFAVRSVLPLAPMIRAVVTVGGTVPSYTFGLRAYGKAKKTVGGA